MFKFDSGVTDYVVGQAIVTVFFPVDKRGVAEVACKHCKFYDPNRRLCWLTKDIVNYPEKFVGTDCPLDKICEDNMMEDIENE